MSKISKKPEAVYYFRGMIERGGIAHRRPSYHWLEGWSMNHPNGGVLYPWKTKRECQSEAKQHGHRAVFVREK